MIGVTGLHTKCTSSIGFIDFVWDFTSRGFCRFSFCFTGGVAHEVLGWNQLLRGGQLVQEPEAIYPRAHVHLRPAEHL